MCIIYAAFKMIEPEDSIRAGTSLGPPPFIQGCKTLDPQTDTLGFWQQSRGQGFAQRTTRLDSWGSDEEQPLSWVSRKPARATGSIGVEQAQLKIVQLQDAPVFNQGDAPVAPQT